MTANAARTTVNARPDATGSARPRASRATTAPITVATPTGIARRTSVVSPRAAAPAVTIPPIHARNVPSCHQTGRYHQVLPPPIASQVHGYALKGRNNTISIALNTTVPTNPMAAAPAIPSAPRAPVHAAGRKATAITAPSTIRASTAPRNPPASGTIRDTARNTTTATPVTSPIPAPPNVTVRKSDRSEARGTEADMRRSLLGYW